MGMRILDDISEFIFIKNEPQKADMIFIPGGSYPELGEQAAELWKQEFAPLVMPSGGVSIKTGEFNGVKSKKEIYNKDYKTEVEFLADVLKINGVSEDAIFMEDKASFTKENGILSRKLADEHELSIEKAILICKSFHARRTLMCYQLAFPNTEFLIHPIPYYDGGTLISRDNWYKTEAGIKRVMGELQRCGNQFTEEILNLRETL